MTITVRVFGVSTDDSDVDFEDRVFESYDKMFETLIEENGETDVYGEDIWEVIEK